MKMETVVLLILGALVLWAIVEFIRFEIWYHRKIKY